MATTEIAARYGRLLAIVANRVDPDQLDAVRDALAGPVPAYVIPQEPFLTAPTVGDLLEACGGTLRSGDPEMLSREAIDVLVGAMTLPNVLDRLVDGGVVVTPSDRVDVLLGVLMAHASQTFPALAGVFLNGGFDIPPQIEQLVAGMGPRLPIVTTQGDTYPTATRLASARGRLSKESPRKVERALTLFEKHVDGGELLTRLDVTRSDVVTPLMFEHELLDRARTNRRHIVLPEGDEERIIRAADTLLRREVADLTMLGDPDLVKRRPTSSGWTSARRESSIRTTRAPGAVRHRVFGLAGAQGSHRRHGARRRRRRVVLRHDDGAARTGRRHGVRFRAHHCARFARRSR